MSTVTSYSNPLGTRLSKVNEPSDFVTRTLLSNSPGLLNLTVILSSWPAKPEICPPTEYVGSSSLPPAPQAASEHNAIAHTNTAGTLKMHFMTHSSRTLCIRSGHTRFARWAAHPCDALKGNAESS